MTTSLDDPARRTPEVAQALDDIARDADARARFLDFARDADQPAVRVRMLKVARDLGWLSADERWEELALMLGELQARSAVGVTEVDLACTLNQEHDLDGAFNRRVAPGSPADDVPHAAVRACLGSAEGRARTLEGLVSTERGGRPDRAGLSAAPAHHRRRRVAPGRRRASPACRRPMRRCARWRPWAGTTCPIATILDMLTRLFARDVVVVGPGRDRGHPDPRRPARRSPARSSCAPCSTNRRPSPARRQHDRRADPQAAIALSAARSSATHRHAHR